MTAFKIKQNANGITINGQTYRSAEEMPPEVRRQYDQAMALLGDRNLSPSPDLLQASTTAGIATDSLPGIKAGAVMRTSTIRRWTINGQSYTDWNAIPENYRQVLRAAGEATDPAAPGGAAAPEHLPPTAAPQAGVLEDRLNRMERADAGRGITIRFSLSALLTLAVALLAAGAALAWLCLR